MSRSILEIDLVVRFDQCLIGNDIASWILRVSEMSLDGKMPSRDGIHRLRRCRHLAHSAAITLDDRKSLSVAIRHHGRAGNSKEKRRNSGEEFIL